MAPLNGNILERLDCLIRESGMNQKEFARLVGMSPSAITELLNGRVKKISNPFLLILFLQFGIRKQWLLTGEGAMSNPVIKTKTGFEVNILASYRKLSATNLRAFKVICDAMNEKQRLKL